MLELLVIQHIYGAMRPKLTLTPFSGGWNDNFFQKIQILVLILAEFCHKVALKHGENFFLVKEPKILI